MSVETIHPLVMERLPYWTLIRDCIEGEMQIKKRGEIYLPRKSGQSQCDYDKYKARAKWADYTEQALNAMHGMIFRKAPVIEKPDNKDLESVLENFDREGHTFYQFASTACYDNMQTYFGGLLLDMPVVEDVITEYDAMHKGIRPYVKYYSGETLINWKYDDESGSRKLCLVVLKEVIEDHLDEFSHDEIVQYRVLDLFEGIYRVRIFRTNEESFTPVAEMYPVVRGEHLDYIPFEFLPYNVPQKPLLYGIAELNKHYYMQSADYENGVHYTTIPTGYITGHSSDKDDTPLNLGADIILEIPNEQSKVGTLQFAGEGLTHCENAIATTLEQIGILGTRAVSPDKAMSETSDAAKIHRAGEHAKLATYARDVSEVFTRVLQIISNWMGIDGKINVTLNVDYDTISFDPNMLNAIANLSREGKFPLPFIWEALVRGELAPNGFTLEDFITLIDMEGADITPLEELELYKKMREGKKFEIPNDKSISFVKDSAFENDKSPDMTKTGSMQAGK